MHRSSLLLVHAGKAGLLKGFGHEHQVRAHAFTGTVVYFPGDLGRSRVRVTVLTDSLRVVPEADSADIPEITKTMRSKTLRVDSFPEITLVSQLVVPIEAGDAAGAPGAAGAAGAAEPKLVRVTGDFTMVGRTRAVSVDLALDVSADTLRAEGSFVVKQTDFGIKPYSTALGLVKVKDEVRFELRVVAVATWLPLPPRLLQHGLRRLLDPRPHVIVRHDDPGAGVPPQDRGIVAGGPQRLRLLVALHCAAQMIVHDGAGAGRAPVEQRLAAALEDDALVVAPLVLAVEPREQRPRRLHGPRLASGEPVRQRQEHGDQRPAVARVDREHVLTDALRLPRLVEQPVALRPLERRLDRVPGDPLEREHGSLLFATFPGVSLVHGASRERALFATALPPITATAPRPPRGSARWPRRT
ncbi:MAG: YceI family protein [Gemmatimonadetes bacterium]|nr:YceI family protein [Gemmatimonadota bacterium]